MTFEDIKFSAFEARALYRAGLIDRAEAKIRIIPYIEEFNKRTSAIAEKYGLSPRKISFAGFVR